MKENKDYFYKVLLKAINEQDIDLIETCFDIIEYLYNEKYIKDKLEPIYKQSILQIWISYTLLERILDSLEVNKKNRKYYTEILNINKFNNEDVNDIETFMVPIWNKCLWNLYKTDAIIETLYILKQYINSSYEGLRNTAKTLVQKLK